MNDFYKKAVPWQKKCIEEIEEKKNVILASPTGSGKTSVYKEWAKLKGNNRVYITSPIKALSNQRYRELLSEGYKVGIETGDIKSVPEDCEYICCTQEIYTNKYASDKSATLVIDEFHYIFDNPSRARTYIDSLNNSQADSILLCSATFGNMDELKEYVERVSGRSFHSYENKERLTELYYDGRISEEEIHDALVVAFSKRGCERIVDQLGYYRNDQVEKFDQISTIARKYKIENLSILESVKKGIACYYGSLLPKEKLFIEELFENRLIDTVVGTDALALGVNFPVENVVFAQLAKYYEGPITKNLFEQIAGRAGRKGYFDEGHVYYCNDFRSLEARGYDTYELYYMLLEKENESISIELTPNISQILRGEISIEEEADFIVKYSTCKKDVADIQAKIEEVIEYINNYDIVGSILENDDYTEEQENDIRKRFIPAQKEFEENISKVYFDEYDHKMNCSIFRDILIGKSLKEIMRSYIYDSFNNEYNFSQLLQLRKYLKGLPKKYRKSFNISEIEGIINNIDETALNLDRGALTVDEIDAATRKEQGDFGEMIEMLERNGSCY